MNVQNRRKIQEEKRKESLTGTHYYVARCSPLPPLQPLLLTPGIFHSPLPALFLTWQNRSVPSPSSTVVRSVGLPRNRKKEDEGSWENFFARKGAKDGIFTRGIISPFAPYNYSIKLPPLSLKWFFFANFDSKM